MKSEKIFESEKRQAKVEKIIEKLKAKSKIFNFENCKRKAKAEVLWFHFPTLFRIGPVFQAVLFTQIFSNLIFSAIIIIIIRNKESFFNLGNSDNKKK